MAVSSAATASAAAAAAAPAAGKKKPARRRAPRKKEGRRGKSGLPHGRSPATVAKSLIIDDDDGDIIIITFIIIIVAVSELPAKKRWRPCAVPGDRSATTSIRGDGPSCVLPFDSTWTARNKPPKAHVDCTVAPFTTDKVVRPTDLRRPSWRCAYFFGNSCNASLLACSVGLGRRRRR